MSLFPELQNTTSEVLSNAVNATRSREYFAQWSENMKSYGETAMADGLARFTAQCNAPFTRLLQQSSAEFYGEEESPYGLSLGITYPCNTPAELIANATAAQLQWSSLTLDDRAAVLIHCLENVASDFFEIAHATQHTTGQGFVMAFQASGPHSLDRALEAIAVGYDALNTTAKEQTWTKPMGKMSVTLQKKFHVVPKGINIVIGCSTFPVWNSLPGMFASLITGASSIAKVHPKAVYPLAIVVASIQKTLQSLGINPHVVQLAVPTATMLLTKELIQDDAVGSVDYTGSSQFGEVVEKLCAEKRTVCFTEKAGVNCVILESIDNLDAVLDNLAFSVSLYSGQMCTAPQNIFIPKDGVRHGDTLVPFRTVVEQFSQKVSSLTNHEKMGAGTLGAIQSNATLERVTKVKSLGLPIALENQTVPHHGFENARTSSVLVVEATDTSHDIYQQEWFGPIIFVIAVDSIDAAIDAVTLSIKNNGALTTLCYTTSSEITKKVEKSVIAAGAPIAFNFVGPIWVNQSAAFSDYHGAGANPAGNASFTDSTFVTARVNIIGSRFCV